MSWNTKAASSLWAACTCTFIACTAHGQGTVGFSNATKLSTEDFAPFDFRPTVLLDADSREGLSRTWQPLRSPSDWYLSIDPEGNVVVPAVKRVDGSRVLQLVRLNSLGQILGTSPARYNHPLPTGQMDANSQLGFANVAFQVGSHFPLVRDLQGGTCRFLTVPFTSSGGNRVLTIRALGERINIVNSATNLAQRLGETSLSFLPNEYSPSDFLQGIRHANGAWAGRYSASGSAGFVLNLDVPAEGPPAADGRDVAFVRSSQRVRDGNAWMEFGSQSQLTTQFYHWQFAASGRGAFALNSLRYTTPTRPASPAFVLAIWTATPSGELTLIARALAAGEPVSPTTPTHVFRSINLKSMSLNTHGEVAFNSEQGLAQDAMPAPGVFHFDGTTLNRVLSLGDSVSAGPQQSQAVNSIVSAINTTRRVQLNDRGDLLTTANLSGQTDASLVLRLAQADRQSALSGWIRVVGPGDRLLNAPQWKVVLMGGANPTQTISSTASLNNRGQVLLMALIEGPFDFRTTAFLSFDLQTGLNLVWADQQPKRDPVTQALSIFDFSFQPVGLENWNPTNSGFAERFNDAGQFATWASIRRPPLLIALSSPSAALLFTIKQAANRGDLGSQTYPLLADGIIDNNDLVAFTNLFFDGSLRADLTNDGILDGSDITQMIEFFNNAEP